MRIIRECERDMYAEYLDLETYEQFIFDDGYEWFAIKIDDEYCVWLNGVNKFVVVKVYRNCMTLGAGAVYEFDSFNVAENYAKSKPNL